MNTSNLKRYYLDIHSTGVQSHIGLNNLPLLTDATGAGVRTLLPVNEWIMPGTNTLTVHVSWPESRPYAKGLAEVAVSLFEADPASEFPTAKQVLAEVTWPHPTDPETYPKRLEKAVKIELVPPTTLWADAETITQLADPDRAAILTLTENFRQTLMAGDFEAAVKFLGYRCSDDALANGLQADEVRSTLIEQFKFMMSEPAPASSPLDPEAASFQIGAAGKVVKVAGPNHKDAIVIETQEARYQIAIFAAKIGGRWTLVR